MSRNKSKYSYEDRKQIAQIIENIKNDADYIAIFDILLQENSRYTENSNGVFLNFSTVSDNSLDKINKYLNKINSKKSNEIEMDMAVIPQTSSNRCNRTHKLSNYEQSIIRQRNIKKVLNEENDYEELKLDNKSKKTTRSKSSTTKSHKSAGSKTAKNKKSAGNTKNTKGKNTTTKKVSNARHKRSEC